MQLGWLSGGGTGYGAAMGKRVAMRRVNRSSVLVKSGFSSEEVIWFEGADGVGASKESYVLAICIVHQVQGVLVVVTSQRQNGKDICVCHVEQCVKKYF